MVRRSGIFLLVFLSSRARKIIVLPLTEIIRSMSRVAREKNYAVRIRKGRDDEFGVLIDRFNEMVGEIQIRDEELQEYNSGLERMVESRTRDLSEAKSELERMVLDLRKAKEEAEVEKAKAPRIAISTGKKAEGGEAP